MIGRTISHYEILEILGEGGMGTVYKARDTRLNRMVAMKSLLRGTSADRKARFIQEAQAASALNHPNIVTVYDLLSEAGDDYIVMEFIAGRTLDRVIPKSGLKLDEALKLAIPIASALTAAHEVGITHRDVKPGNVMVREDGLVKVLDFGLAKLTEGAPLEADEATRTMRAQTEEGAILGTISYMSPEQAEGRKIDGRSDIFSFGALLYEMVAGRRAFQGQSKLSTLSAILKEEPKPLHEVDPTSPRELERIVSRCLRKDPERRYQLMKEARLALEELKDESDSGRLSAPVKPSSNRWAVYAGVGLVAALGAGALIWRNTRPAAAPAALPEIRLRQITNDSGSTGMPALSPDGKFIAYSSNRAEDAGMDIWVQQLSEGAQPIRLTQRPGHELYPDFSPDGGQIVFSTEGEGGGLYVMPALGGTQRLLARGPYEDPRFSPDGQWIAANTLGGEHWLYILPVSGGPPRRLGENFKRRLSAAVWSPDGKKILATGRERVDSELDWWIVPVDGGNPVSAGARGVISVPGNAFMDSPRTWLGDSVFFAARNLMRVGISPVGKLVGPPERLTSGSANESSPSAISLPGSGSWRIAYSVGQGTYDLSRLNLVKIGNQPAGSVEPLFRDHQERSTPSVSADGQKLAYVAALLGNYELRVRLLTTGAEQVLVQLKERFRARISPDGSTVAYNQSSVNESETTIFLASTEGGESRKLCDTCGLIYDWTPDGKRLNFRHGNPIRFSEIDIATGAKSQLLAAGEFPFHAASYSPDGQWLAFHYAPGGSAPPGIFLAPLRGGKVAPAGEWIRIMGRRGAHTRPWWARDGNTLYFLSDAGAAVDIWRQKLEPSTKRAAGEPVVFYHPDTETGSRLITGPAFGPGETRDALYFPISRSTSNVWIADLPAR